MSRVVNRQGYASPPHIVAEFTKQVQNCMSMTDDLTHARYAIPGEHRFPFSEDISIAIPWRTLHFMALFLVGFIGILAGTVARTALAQESAEDENPYALCGGTREACDPFSYLNNDYAIPGRGDDFYSGRVYPGRSAYTNNTSAWAGYPSPYGYWGPPGYWGAPGPLRAPGLWPIPVPFGGIPGGSGFVGSFGHPGSGFLFGFGSIIVPPFHIGVQPLPRPNFNHGFGSARPISPSGNRLNHGGSGFNNMRPPANQPGTPRHR
jgi:hypothetical protein